MLIFGAHLVGRVSASVLLEKSFACHSYVVPILIIRSFGSPLRFGNRQMPIIGQVTMESPLIAFVHFPSLKKSCVLSLSSRSPVGKASCDYTGNYNILPAPWVCYLWEDVNVQRDFRSVL